ncbi:heterokaryon incompatibility protein-domain-containing protein [Apiospora kogelbergensis]|uniref:heterokaryon incompatibility protein-domain-containing protein n=1 Tax=Apiospora kogelbergensis TaxID=1337665 RepID=UPI00312D82FF
MVLVWLGPSSDAIDDMMDLIASWGERSRALLENITFLRDIWKGTVTTHMAAHKTNVACFKQLLNGNPWFQRVWVIQEVANASAVTVICGSKSVSSRIFSMMPCIMDLEIDRHTAAVLEVMPGPLRQQSWWNADRRLIMLLTKFSGSKASQEHDLIYALLGIASDAETLDLGFRNIVTRLHATEPMKFNMIFSHILLRSGRDEQIQILLDHGINNETILNDEWVYESLKGRDFESLRVFLQIRGAAGIESPLSATRIMWSVVYELEDTPDRERVGLLEAVISCGADIEAPYTDRTPLQHAILTYSHCIVRVLVHRGANLGTCTENGQTPLHYAEQVVQPDGWNHRKILAELYIAGADDLAMDSNGRTPWQLNIMNRVKQEKRRPWNKLSYLIDSLDGYDSTDYKTLFEGRDG